MYIAEINSFFDWNIVHNISVKDYLFKFKLSNLKCINSLMLTLLKDTLHPVHMRQPVVAVGTKHCQPVDAVDTKGCCCNTCFGRFHWLVYPQHRISKGVADYLSEVSQSRKAEWWIYFVLWLGLWEFWPWPWKSNRIQYKGALLPPWINFNPSMDK